ncbi:MAG: hypothetical protein AB7P99_11695 [Vicinamibacterales bacterium]
MNWSRIVAAGVVAWLASMAVGFLVNDVLLVDLAAPNLAVMRPEADIMTKLPIGFAGTLAAFLAFAYMYARGYEGGSGLHEGIRFGFVAGVVVCGFGVVWFYVAYPITATYGAAMVVDWLAESTIYGAVVGSIYRPAAKPAAVVAAI